MSPRTNFSGIKAPRLSDCADATGSSVRQRLDELAVEQTQHLAEIASAFQQMTARRENRVLALRRFQRGMLLDRVVRVFARAAVHGKNRAVGKEVDGVVPPIAGSDHASVDAKNLRKLAAPEANLGLRAGRPFAPIFCPRGGAVARAEERYGFLGHHP